MTYEPLIKSRTGRPNVGDCRRLDDAKRKEMTLRDAKTISRAELDAKYVDILESSGEDDDMQRQEALARLFRILHRDPIASPASVQGSAAAAASGGQPLEDTQARIMLLGASYQDCTCADPRYDNATHAVIVLHGVTTLRQSAVVRIHGITPHMYIDLSALPRHPAEICGMLHDVIELAHIKYLAAIGDCKTNAKDAEATAASRMLVGLDSLKFLDTQVVKQLSLKPSTRQYDNKYRPKPSSENQAQQPSNIATMVCASVLWAKSYYSYSAPCPFLRIDTTHPQVVPAVRKTFETGGSLWSDCPPLPPCECDLEFVTRALVDILLRGGDWFDVLLDRSIQCTAFDHVNLPAEVEHRYPCSDLYAVAKKPALTTATWYAGMNADPEDDWRRQYMRRVSTYDNATDEQRQTKYLRKTCPGAARWSRMSPYNQAKEIGWWWRLRVYDFCQTSVWPTIAAKNGVDAIYYRDEKHIHEYGPLHNLMHSCSKKALHCRTTVFDRFCRLDNLQPADDMLDSDEWLAEDLECGPYKGMPDGPDFLDVEAGPKCNDVRADHRISAGLVVDVPSPEFIIARGSSVEPFSRIADIRTLSFDTEEAGFKGRFPIAAEDSIITICVTVQDKFGIPASSAAKPGTLQACRCSKINFQLGRFDAVVPQCVKCAPSTQLGVSHADGAAGAVDVAPQVYVEVDKPAGVTDERPTVDASVWFSSEAQMLLAFRDLVLCADPDVIVGYNNCGFDFKYMFERMRALQIGNLFPVFTRFPTEAAHMSRKVLTTRAFGSNEIVDVECRGRIVLDLLQIMKREFKLRSYTLNAVGETFVDAKKEDLPHEQILPHFFSDNPSLRGDLARYCSTDTVLPLRIMQKLVTLVSILEMCRATGVLPAQLYSRGQSIKTVSLLYRDCLSNGYIIPTRSLASPHAAMRGVEMEGKYSGAFVVPPVKGVHTDVVATLDFSSLYPSIMCAHNLCHTTYLPIIVPIGTNSETPEAADNNSDGDISKVALTAQQEADLGAKLQKYDLKLADVEVSPEGYVFVRTALRKGTMPRILEQLLKLRKQAKRDLAAAEDRHDGDMASVYDKRQLALKIAANSIYGFTGDRNGKLPCSGIAKSVTGYGRGMIGLTIKTVLTEFKREKRGFMPPTHPAAVLAAKRRGLADTSVGCADVPWCPKDAAVYYGDTDSIMFTVGIDLVDGEKMLEYDSKKHLQLTEVGAAICRQMADIAIEASKMVTKLFPPPIAILFEKLLIGSMLLIAKKRYASVSIELSDKSPNGFAEPHMFVRGLESVRRDNCKIVPRLVSFVLEQIIVHRDARMAIEETARLVERLQTNKVDVSQLIVTKQYSKEVDSLTGRQAHVEIAKRLGLSVGDRVPYVNVVARKKDPAYIRGVHPLEMIMQNKEIDAEHYITKQLMRPLCRIFRAVINDTSRLFDSSDMLCHALMELRRDAKYKKRLLINAAGNATATSLVSLDIASQQRTREYKLLADTAVRLAKMPLAAFQELESTALQKLAQGAADGHDNHPDQHAQSDHTLSSAKRSGAGKSLLSVAMVGISRNCVVCGSTITHIHHEQPEVPSPQHDELKAVPLPAKSAKQAKSVSKKHVAPVASKACPSMPEMPTKKQRTLKDMFQAPTAIVKLDPAPIADQTLIEQPITQIASAPLPDVTPPPPSKVEQRVVPGLLCPACMSLSSQLHGGDMSIVSEANAVDVREKLALLRMALARKCRKCDRTMTGIFAECTKCHTTTTGHYQSSRTDTNLQRPTSCLARSIADSTTIDMLHSEPGETDKTWLATLSLAQQQDDSSIASALKTLVATLEEELHVEHGSMNIVSMFIAVARSRWICAKNLSGADRIYTILEGWDEKDNMFHGPVQSNASSPSYTVDIEDLTRSCSNTDCEHYFRRINLRLERIAIAIAVEATLNNDWHTAMMRKYAPHTS